MIKPIRSLKILNTLSSSIVLCGILFYVSTISCISTPEPLPSSLADPVAYRLYAQHCAACHGSRGLGDGPAAISLQVKPRNFWHERFRYVSTLNGVPTKEDLKQTIQSGRRYGDMPSNPQLSENEIAVLSDYILEMQRLGWVELLTREFADDDDTEPEEIQEIAQERIVAQQIITVTYPTSGFNRDIERGRSLFKNNCASCHGTNGRGDGLDQPLDERGKPIEVRDLTSGQFRGSNTKEDIFKRIRCGIPGTPMSAALSLTDEEVWQLINYVRYLSGRY